MMTKTDFMISIHRFCTCEDSIDTTAILFLLVHTLAVSHLLCDLKTPTEP